MSCLVCIFEANPEVTDALKQASVGQTIVLCGLPAFTREGESAERMEAAASQPDRDDARSGTAVFGFNATTATVGVASRASVHAVVEKATLLGEVFGLIHAAGVLPSQATPETVLKVDLDGTALALEESPSWTAESLRPTGTANSLRNSPPKRNTTTI